MPRQARTLGDQCVYHVSNRGQAGQQVFRQAHDYLAFLDMLLVARTRYNIELYAFCLLPDHFHLLARPEQGSNLSNGMQWLQTSFARRFNNYYNSEGPLWQGRYKSCLVQEDSHLLLVMRFIESHPLRAGLAETAEDYVWSSHRDNAWGNQRRKLDEPPVALTGNWSAAVDAVFSESILQRLVLCTQRQVPFGTRKWQQQQCRAMGIEASLRPRGRPVKQQCARLLPIAFLLGLLMMPARPALAGNLKAYRLLKASGPDQAAVVRGPGGRAQLVRVGDTLDRLARVTAIDNNHIVLEQPGEHGPEILVMAKAGVSSLAPRSGALFRGTAGKRPNEIQGVCRPPA